MVSVQERAAWVAEVVEVWTARSRLAAIDWEVVEAGGAGPAGWAERPEGDGGAERLESDGSAGRTAEFDVAGHVLRARRRGDLSQRELAALLGVSQSTVNRYEQPGAEIGVRHLAQALAEGGLRLAVVDESGQEVVPVRADEVRDNAGRRFPAHLEVLPPDQVPSQRTSRPRYDRSPATAWYHHRVMRDCYRAVRAGEVDHPTVTDLAQRGWVLRCRPREARSIRLAERRLRALAAKVHAAEPGWVIGHLGEVRTPREGGGEAITPP
ncbi:helix-turn-helix domain-containing protein [Occultella gossypii]|uniref:Helix-turn-helix transcriptional regulator n=1 Tax=Occultella gossypii TaxID=2800820 RepID=A0ABS7SC21_9MICO|nr:helix-turn-helix transcriptional regulator [Occultella gossypii]MBZ2197812.1 helix-turn-helix transcriptional regulator [Occultella gossypii]